MFESFRKKEDHLHVACPQNEEMRGANKGDASNQAQDAIARKHKMHAPQGAPLFIASCKGLRPWREQRCGSRPGAASSWVKEGSEPLSTARCVAVRPLAPAAFTSALARRSDCMPSPEAEAEAEV